MSPREEPAGGISKHLALPPAKPLTSGWGQAQGGTALAEEHAQNHQGWERPLRTSPTAHPTPPRLLNHVPRCHLHADFEPLQGYLVSQRALTVPHRTLQAPAPLHSPPSDGDASSHGLLSSSSRPCRASQRRAPAAPARGGGGSPGPLPNTAFSALCSGASRCGVTHGEGGRGVGSLMAGAGGREGHAGGAPAHPKPALPSGVPPRHRPEPRGPKKVLRVGRRVLQGTRGARTLRVERGKRSGRVGVEEAGGEQPRSVARTSAARLRERSLSRPRLQSQRYGKATRADLPRCPWWNPS